MIYDTGDTHANQRKWMEQIEVVLQKGDTIIVNGDFGVGFWGSCSRSEEGFYDYLAARDYTVLFIDGNHENFEKLSDFPVEIWHGGRVHKIRNNVIHLMRGEVCEIEGHTIFAMGGGYSLDKDYRTPGVSWWPQEMPSDEEYALCEKTLEENGWQVDYVLTHDAPSRFLDFTALALGESNRLHLFLDKILLKLHYEKWFFGCYHKDVALSTKSRCVFCEIIPMK